MDETQQVVCVVLPWGFQALGQAPDPTQWADFGLYAKEAPRAPETDRIQRTQLPLALGDTMRVALVGNTLFERMGHYGFLNRGSIRNIRKPNSSSETWLGQRIRSVCDLDRTILRISNNIFFEFKPI